MKPKIPNVSPAKRATVKKIKGSSAAPLKNWLSKATESHILFPTIAALVLALIWGTTLNLIKVERAAAERTAAALSRELTETYEAQVIRALREIDLTLKIVKSAYEVWGPQNVLQKLKARDLLPPALLFNVSIANQKGEILASTNPKEVTEIVDPNSFKNLTQTDVMLIGTPRRDMANRERHLYFGRRLSATGGENAGMVIVQIDAAYFVSGYETSKLGEHGVLGILGSDDAFLVLRSGELLSEGERADYEAMVPSMEEHEVEGALISNAWDGVRRYTSAGQLYGFPLAVIVGLSADEQLAATQRNKQLYLWRATIGSLLLILIVTALGYMSRQLALSRLRAINEQVAHAKRVEYLAYHDSLTTLPNRSLFSKLLDHSIKQVSRYNRKLAVLFFDLDHFKNINDTLGHEAGDELLQEVAIRVKACLRDSDTVARMGGDEFVVLLPELDEEKYVATVAQKILSAVARSFILQGKEFSITASIGISTYPQDGLNEQTLTKNADIAMYQVKEEGRNNFMFFSEKMNSESLERLSLESGLRHALEHHEFQLHYQVKREIQSGRITGMEALLRWQHPDLGTVAPMKFIPIAEEIGLILPIGKWVLRTVCRQNVDWQRQGLPHLCVAINLTARQFFDEELLTDLKAILMETGMEARLLELDITESILMHDIEKSMRVMNQLKAMGVLIAIDNFGVGYSSFSMLKQFPLDTIKIDRSFIRDIASGASDRDLTKAIIAMGKTLSLDVVAQGVETKEQADYLRQNACDEFQGFYLNKPVPADQLAELLRTQSDITETDAIT